jgi:hypothetical protein
LFEDMRSEAAAEGGGDGYHVLAELALAEAATGVYCADALARGISAHAPRTTSALDSGLDCALSELNGAALEHAGRGGRW